ncbi:MAG: alpha/beta fold hydrolase, partial [Nannocystis sp.]
MVTSQIVKTSRLAVHTLTAGPRTAPPVVLIHGNVSSAVFWEPLMAALAADHHVIAPDLRGYGTTEPLVIDATRGLRDLSDDLHALLHALEIVGPVHLLGWSAGAGVCMQFT